MLVSQNQEKDIQLCRRSIVLTVNIGLSGVKIQFILGISNKAPATFTLPAKLKSMTTLLPTLC